MQAKAAARSITGSGRQADALAQVAEILARDGGLPLGVPFGCSLLHCRAVDNLCQTNTATSPILFCRPCERAGWQEALTTVSVETLIGASTRHGISAGTHIYGSLSGCRVRGKNECTTLLPLRPTTFEYKQRVSFIISHAGEILSSTSDDMCGRSVSIHGVRARHAGARRWLNF